MRWRSATKSSSTGLSAAWNASSVRSQAASRMMHASVLSLAGDGGRATGGSARLQLDGGLLNTMKSADSPTISARPGSCPGKAMYREESERIES
jgi:hypothetical protein